MASLWSWLEHRDSTIMGAIPQLKSFPTTLLLDWAPFILGSLVFLTHSPKSLRVLCNCYSFLLEGSSTKYSYDFTPFKTWFKYYLLWAFFVSTQLYYINYSVFLFIVYMSKPTTLSYEFWEGRDFIKNFIHCYKLRKTVPGASRHSKKYLLNQSII